MECDLSRLAIHTITTKAWSLRQCIDGFSAAGVKGISVWRNVIDPAQGGVAPSEAGRMLHDAGMTVPALVRGGFFVAAESVDRQKAIDDNRLCIDEAAAIGAEMVVLVVGAQPGIALDNARGQVTDGIAALLDHAEGCGVKLAIEPLHPMYAADRSCINRMAEARAVCEQLPHDLLGIAADVYHIWWDPDLENELRLAGEQGTLFGYHICDWKVDTADLLNDRGLMGEGVIDLPAIAAMVERAGFTGRHEVEIFSNRYWAMDPAEYVAKIVEAFATHG